MKCRLYIHYSEDVEGFTPVIPLLTADDRTRKYLTMSGTRICPRCMWGAATYPHRRQMPALPRRRSFSAEMNPPDSLRAHVDRADANAEVQRLGSMTLAERLQENRFELFHLYPDGCYGDPRNCPQHHDWPEKYGDS